MADERRIPNAEGELCRSFSRALARVTGALVCAAAVLAVADACVIVDPPGDVLRLPTMRPTILRASVVPSASTILATWPRDDKFIVPVELVDPSATVWWATFVDYNAATGEGLQTYRQSPYTVESTVMRTRVLDVTIDRPSLDRCHTVEVVVTLDLNDITDRRRTHAPFEPGGDIVTWFFNPGGDPAGCPSLDAGIDAPVRDVAEAGEAGAE